MTKHPTQLSRAQLILLAEYRRIDRLLNFRKNVYAMEWRAFTRLSEWKTAIHEEITKHQLFVTQ